MRAQSSTSKGSAWHFVARLIASWSADVSDNAVRAMRIATGEIPEHAPRSKRTWLRFHLGGAGFVKRRSNFKLSSADNRAH